MIFKKEVRLAPLASVLLLFLIINDANLNEVQVLLDADCLAYYMDHHYAEYDLNCFRLTNQALYSREYKCLKNISNYSTSDLNNQTCEFNYDALYYDSQKFAVLRQLKDVSWSCRLNSTDNICDGESQCLTDECGCTGEHSTDVFFCLDGSGCISWSQLCDNIQDCKDGSDECFCHGHLVFFSPEFKQWGCYTEEYYCDYFFRGLPQLNKTPEVLRDIDCMDTVRNKYNEKNPIVLCLENDEVLEKYYIGFSNGPIEVLFEYCRHNCSHIDGFNDGWARYCQNIFADISHYLYSFACNKTNIGENYPLIQVCDGKTDCTNGTDESGCPFPDRFHCAPNVTAEWINIDKVCDSVKDCSNGADECGTCQFEALSSSEFLIQSRIIVAVTSIMGIVIIVLNLKEGYKCFKTSCASNIKAIDRIFLLQIFLYDGLMGAYICSIVLASIVLKVKGNYCLLEQDWRASPFCSGLGVIFSFSSHGSLLAIAAISTTRFLTCHSLLTEISKKAVLVVSIIGACCNILHSVFPLLPMNEIQDTFRTAIFFKNLNENPFLNKSSPFNRSSLTELYNKIFHDKGEHDIYEMSQKLSNITTKRDIFDLSEIGYYGNTGLCVHNIFKDHGENPMYRIYKILYCTVLLVLLIIVSIAYIKIVLKMRSSAQATNSDAAASASAALTFKVALMIGSQLACWIPFIITVSYFQYMTQNPASPIVFEAFALVVIPINSFLNPVFYSELYKKAKEKVLEKMFPTKIEPSAEVGNGIPVVIPTKMRQGNQFLKADPSNQAIEAEPRNLSTEVHPRNKPAGVKPRNQFTEAQQAQPSNQSIEMRSSYQSTKVQSSILPAEAEPSTQSTEVKPSNQSTEVQPSNQSTEVQPSNQSTEVHANNQSTKVKPSNQSTEVHANNQSTEVKPSNQSTEVQPSNESTEVHANNQSTEVKPSNQSTKVQSSILPAKAEPSTQSTEVQPSNQSTEVHANNQSTEVHANNQSTEVQPSDQSTEVKPSNQSTEVHANSQSTEVQANNQSTEVKPSNQSTEVQPSNQSTEVQPSNQSTEVHANN